MKPESNDRRDDVKAANSARPRDYEYTDAERDASYDAYLASLDMCPDCDGWLCDGIPYAGEPEYRYCPRCGYAEYADE